MRMQRQIEVCEKAMQREEQSDAILFAALQVSLELRKDIRQHIVERFCGGKI